MENPLLRLNGTAIEQQQNSNRTSIEYQQNINKTSRGENNMSIKVIFRQHAVLHLRSRTAVFLSLKKNVRFM